MEHPELEKPALIFEAAGSQDPSPTPPSLLGAVTHGAPEEDWPEDGFEPALQLNLAEIPFRPEKLQGVSFLTVFLSANGVHVRTYKSLKNVVEKVPSKGVRLCHPWLTPDRYEPAQEPAFVKVGGWAAVLNDAYLFQFQWKDFGLAVVGRRGKDWVVERLGG